MICEHSTAKTVIKLEKNIPVLFESRSMGALIHLDRLVCEADRTTRVLEKWETVKGG